MRTPFADAVYWIALVNSRDQWHSRATAASLRLTGTVLVTTEDVLVEVLAHYAESGRRYRQEAVHFVEAILNNPRVIVYPQSHQSFLDGLALYKSRLDKGYSLTDCISMVVMRREKITEVLTYDNHFAQEGFTLLL